MVLTRQRQSEPKSPEKDPPKREIPLKDKEREEAKKKKIGFY